MKDKIPKMFKGQTVACIASGPSLTKSDCELIEQSKIPTIAINMSWKMARFAKIIYAGDFVWWQHYRNEIDIDAEQWTCCKRSADDYKINYHDKRGAYNSGLRAVELALEMGASKVLLLGYDASVDNGTHWHADYKLTRNPDELRCHKWLRYFDHLRGKNIINCAPNSALTQFPKMTLEMALEIENSIS
jgi:hypothetical protein